MVNNIGNNKISEIDARKDLNTLDKIKIAEIIKYKRRTPGHKELLDLFNDLLNIILSDKTLESESQEDKNKNENEKVESREEKMEMKIMKIEMNMKMKMNIMMNYEYKNESEYEYENENKDDDETMS